MFRKFSHASGALQHNFLQCISSFCSPHGVWGGSSTPPGFDAQRFPERGSTSSLLCKPRDLHSEDSKFELKMVSPREQAMCLSSLPGPRRWLLHILSHTYRNVEEPRPISDRVNQWQLTHSCAVIACFLLTLFCSLQLEMFGSSLIWSNGGRCNDVKA